ncbi:hypothetical protein AB0368_18780 [Actinoplanes sp. NPDC051475]|uniref:hypothetical protein n=1 Tax=Actinoplanes sp. NPDC051475 TaxID=3157225 RepID=UPI00344E3E4C
MESGAERPALRLRELHHALATTAERRSWLGLAVREVWVSRGQRGKRFDPQTRLRIDWISQQ